MFDISNYDYLWPINNPISYTATVVVPPSAYQAIWQTILNSWANILTDFFWLLGWILMFMVVLTFIWIIPLIRNYMTKKLWWGSNEITHRVKIQGTSVSDLVKKIK